MQREAAAPGHEPFFAGARPAARARDFPPTDAGMRTRKAAFRKEGGLFLCLTGGKRIEVRGGTHYQLFLLQENMQK